MLSDPHTVCFQETWFPPLVIAETFHTNWCTPEICVPEVMTITFELVSFCRQVNNENKVTGFRIAVGLMFDKLIIGLQTSRSPKMIINIM